MTPEAILELSLAELAAAVREGAASAREVVEAYAGQLAIEEPEVHAFLHLDLEAARARAAEIDAMVRAGHDPGPLAGVPVAVKDNIVMRGAPTTAGSRMLEGWVPPYDATVVERLLAAGAVVVGKTNLDEFAMGSSTENSAFGPTRNPVDLDRVPGGSSGGSAAAVAARLAAVALGSDTGGSIRQPAALCGVVGLKPTYGAVSRYGLIAFASSLDQIGPLATSVEDAALVLEVIGGHDPRDATSARRGPLALMPQLDVGVSGVRVGVVEELLATADEEVRASVERAARALEAAGARVVRTSIPEVAAALAAYYVIAPAEASSNLARFDGVRYGPSLEAPTTDELVVRTRTSGFGDEVRRRIMLGTYALSAGYRDALYVQAQRVRAWLAGGFARAYEGVDVLLAPTSPTTAFRLGERADDPVAMYRSDVCTVPSNLVGHPGVSVPFGLDHDRLPIGVQVLAPAWQDGLMLAVAAELERRALR